jgi:phytoene dehydrogenase-like protein
MTNGRGRVVIIGAGHNGLVTAFYLAKAGFSPLVLERREIVGGIAVNEEIHPGFRCPTVAHSVGPLLPQVMHDLQLEKHGLQITKQAIRVVGLHTNRPPLRIYADPQRTAAELSAVSSSDSKKYPEFQSTLRNIGRALGPFISSTPPDIDHLEIRDYWNLGSFGLKFRGLEKKDAYRLLRWGPMPVADLVAEWFETDLLCSIIAAQGVFGCFAGPRSGGTSIGPLMQAAFGSDSQFVSGSTGALTQAISRAAVAAGAQIRTAANVTRIHSRQRKVISVALENGEEIPAMAVISSADPKHTYLKLIDAAELDPSFLTKARALRATGAVAKVNLALSRLPAFSGVSDRGDLSARLQIAPDVEYLERAFDSAKYGEFSSEPYMEITIPSLTDPSLAPDGAHVMSIHVQYTPYQLRNSNWQTRREELGDAVLKTLSMYAPDINDVAVHRQVLTPLDLEQTYGLTGGHIFHVEHSLDQLFSFRPFLGWAQYRTPIRGLYLCGAGTHPGGGITGAPGFNASREIIKDLKA